MKRILVPTDFSVRSNNALTLAAGIASKSGGMVTLLHVVELPRQFHNSTLDQVNADDMTDIYRMKLIETSEKELEIIRNSYSGAGFELVTEIRSGNPYEEIKE